MASFGVIVRGAANPELAWRRYAEPARWPQWSPQIKNVDCADDVLQLGSVGTVHAVLGISVPFEVTVFDAEHKRWAWVATLPLGIRLHLQHSVSADGPSGTVTGLRVSGPAPIVIGYLPVARLALTRLVRP